MEIKKELNYEYCNIAEFINYLEFNWKDKIAFSYDNNKMHNSYNKMCYLVKLMSKKIENEFSKGTHIALYGDFDFKWLCAFFAIISAGCIVIPIQKTENNIKIKEILYRSDTNVIFYNNYINEEIFKNYLKENLTDYINYSIGNGITSEIEFGKRCYSEDEAIIIYTSGTTGEQKGVIITNKNLCSNIRGFIKLIFDIIDCDDRTLTILPVNHMFQITVGICCLLNVGMELCLVENLKYISQYYEIYRPNMIVAVPLILENMKDKIMQKAKNDQKYELLKEKLAIAKKLNLVERRKMFKEELKIFGGELRYIICGGAKLDIDIANFFAKLGIIILNGYGLTECSPVISCNIIKNLDNSTVGMPLDDEFCNIKISSDNELLVKGDIVFKGYYKDNKSTKESFLNGWFKTGDLVTIDKENRIKLVGRKKDLIILADGNNISPIELENIFKKNKYINEILITLNKKLNKDILCAIIYIDKTKLNDYELKNINDIVYDEVNKINKTLPKFQRIYDIHIQFEPFQKTSIGKVKRFIYKNYKMEV